MELAMNSKFVEMNEQEMMDVDGGIAGVILAVAAGVVVVSGAVKVFTKSAVAIKIGGAIGGTSGLEVSTNGGVTRFFTSNNCSSLRPGNW